MHFKIKVIAGFILGVFVIYFPNNIVLGQEVDQEALSLVPTEYPLVVHYIDKILKSSDVSAVENTLYPYESLSIPLKKQDVSIPHGGGSILLIELKAFHNGEWIYFLFTWKDQTKDAKVIKHEQNRDAVAVLFPLQEISPDSIFSPRMGDIEKPVNIWHWKADWEEDLRGLNSANRLQSQYKNAPLDYPKEVMEELDQTAGGWGGGNLLSDPSRGHSVEDLNSAKFGTLISQEHQDVFGHAVWSRGRWTVVMARKLSTSDKNDTQLYPGQKNYFSLAVWNGAAGDRNGQKSISDRWHPLEIETTVK
jgi:DMSO reductase family type II enzyme heme b subunit